VFFFRRNNQLSIITVYTAHFETINKQFCLKQSTHFHQFIDYGFSNNKKRIIILIFIVKKIIVEGKYGGILATVTSAQNKSS